MLSLDYSSLGNGAALRKPLWVSIGVKVRHSTVILRTKELKLPQCSRGLQCIVKWRKSLANLLRLDCGFGGSIGRQHLNAHAAIGVYCLVGFKTLDFRRLVP